MRVCSHGPTCVALRFEGGKGDDPAAVELDDEMDSYWSKKEQAAEAETAPAAAAAAEPEPAAAAEGGEQS